MDSIAPITDVQMTAGNHWSIWIGHNLKQVAVRVIHRNPYSIETSASVNQASVHGNELITLVCRNLVTL